MKKKHICTACGHIATPVLQSFPNGLSGDVCAKCGSEDVFPYGTKKEIAEHKAACELDVRDKARAAENTARRRALDGDY
jgi:predicted  nucleic acid-binding Zn-ribbon protein